MILKSVKRKTLTDYIARGNIKYEIIDGYVLDKSTIFEAEQIDRNILEDAASLILKTNPEKRRAVQW